MKFSFYLILVSLLFLMACSQTQLHIVNQGYSEERINSLISKLKKLDVSVVKSNVTIPNNFPNSTVATNPSFTDINLLNSIESLFLASGIESPSHLTFAQGKHFYNVNHLGVYLRNESNVVPTMPPYLRTQYCEFTDATIMFSRDGRFVLEFEKATYDEELAIVKGNYAFDSVSLQLITDHKISQSYSLKREMKQTQLGERPADVFKPDAINSALPALNCEFLIIYME